MTVQEQKSVDRVFSLLSEIREENKKFREDINGQISTETEKVEKKHKPVQFEDQIMDAIDK